MKITILTANYNVTISNHSFHESDLQGYINREEIINIEKLDNLLKSIRNISTSTSLTLKFIQPQMIAYEFFSKGKRLFEMPNINITFSAPNQIAKIYVLDNISDSETILSKMTAKDKEFVSEKILEDLKSQNLNYVSIIESIKNDMIFEVRHSLSNYLKKQENKVNNYKKSMIEAVKLFKRRS